MGKPSGIFVVMCGFLLVAPIFAGLHRRKNDHRTQRIQERADQSYDVIVVGAGLSGLTAATKLNEQGKNVLVLEASNRVGGRMLTDTNPNVGYVDLGAAYIDSNHKYTLEQLAKYNLKTFQTNSAGDALCYRGGRVVRYTDTAGFPTQQDENDMTYLSNTMKNSMEKIKVNATYRASLDQITFQQYLDSTSQNSLVKGNAKMWSRADYCAEPKDVSSLFALKTFKGAGGSLDYLNSLEGTSPVYLCTGGVQQLPLTMAANLAGRVRYGAVVNQIQSSDSGVTVTTANGDQFQASYVIIAMPPIAQRGITLSPPPSIARQQIIQNVPMGSIIKTFAYYMSPLWRQQGLSGYTTCEADDCTIVMSMDYTKPDGSYPALVGFISGDKAIEMSKLTPAQRGVQVAAHYAMIFNNPAMNSPIYYEDYDWISDPWAHGGFGAIMVPGAMTSYGRSLAEPEGRVHYAGTETASGHDGYMDGAIEAGLRAAKEVMDELASPAARDVNAERSALLELLAKEMKVHERKHNRHSANRRA